MRQLVSFLFTTNQFYQTWCPVIKGVREFSGVLISAMETKEKSRKPTKVWRKSCNDVNYPLSTAYLGWKN